LQVGLHLTNRKNQTLMQVFSDHPVMAPEEYCSIYSAENYTQQVFVFVFYLKRTEAYCSVDFFRDKTRLLGICVLRKQKMFPEWPIGFGGPDDSLPTTCNQFGLLLTMHCKKSRRTFRCPFEEYLPEIE
jgi:hypothetical protein